MCSPWVFPIAPQDYPILFAQSSPMSSIYSGQRRKRMHFNTFIALKFSLSEAEFVIWEPFRFCEDGMWSRYVWGKQPSERNPDILLRTLARWASLHKWLEEVACHSANSFSKTLFLGIVNSKPIWNHGSYIFCLNQKLGIEICVCAENCNTENIDMFDSKHHRENFWGLTQNETKPSCMKGVGKAGLVGL
jgi:hypothetical protein